MSPSEPTFVVLADLPRDQRAWFAPLEHRARVVFGARLGVVRQQLGQADGLFVWGHPHDPFEEILLAAPRLRWVHHTGAGVEHLLVPSLVNSRILLTNSRGVHTPAVAELAVGMLLALAKNLPDRARAQARHRWDQQLNRQLAGATLLVLGLGSIGSAVGRAASALGMYVIGVRSAARPSRWARLGARNRAWLCRKCQALPQRSAAAQRRQQATRLLRATCAVRCADRAGAGCRRRASSPQAPR